MRSRSLKAFSLALLFGLMLVGFAPQANAAATLRFILVAPATSTDCADQAGCDTVNGPTGVGTVSTNFAAPGVAVSVTTGISKPVFAQPHTDLNTVTITTSAAADIILLFSDTDFTTGTPGFSLLFGGTLTAGAGSTVSASAYYDNAGVGNNALFCGGAGDNCAANGTLIANLGPFGPGAFSGSAVGAGTFTTPYSLTQAIRLHFTSAASFSGDFELQGVPEPASVALLGGVLLVTVNLLRRKARRA